MYERDVEVRRGDFPDWGASFLIARVPALMASTEKAIGEGQHPMIVAAKWHGYYEYLHPFRDGNTLLHSSSGPQPDE